MYRKDRQRLDAVGTMMRTSLPVRRTVCLASLLVAAVAGTDATAQTGRQLYSARVDSLSGSPQSLRTLVHSVLVGEGFAVREVAACDCFVATDATIMAGGVPMEIRVHILKPPSGIRAAVVIQALVGASGVAAVQSGPPPRAIADVIDLLRRQMARSRVPGE